MAGQGPPRQPESRRGRRDGRRVLPAEGRKGRAPGWPAGLPAPSKVERTLWREVWRTPQAVAWAELGWLRPVARYVAFLAALSDVSADTSASLVKTLATEVRLLEDRLGLSPMAMRHLGWEISGGDAVPISAAAAATAPGAGRSRADVMRVIRGSDGAA